MARSEDQVARGHRLIPLAAGFALALACALTFGRVFTGRSPTVRLAVAALLAVALGWASERRGLALATAVSAIGLLLALTWLVFPQTAWYGLPSPRTLRAIERSLSFVGQQARTQVSPAPAFPPILMAATVAVWAACSSAYTLFARAGSPVLALIPPVALAAFSDLVLEDGVRPGYAAGLLLAALGLVLADGLRRIRQWGPVIAGPTERRVARTVAARGARRVGVAALAAGLLVPGLLPGFRAEPVVDLAGGAGGSVRLDPFVSIHASLNREEATPLLRVTTTDDRAAYWRVLALDVFDGATWMMSDRDLGDARLYPSPARLPGAEIGEPFRQRFEILTDLGDRFLPLAYPPEVVDLGNASVRYDPELGLVQAPDPPQAGDTYTVLSRRVVPTPEELDAVRFGPPADYGRNTFLPEDVPEEVLRIAREWTAGEPTPYRQILAIQRRLLAPDFAYSQDVRPVADAHAIARFLTETKIGFCQQFSTAMAVLVRALGYPARVAVGYRPGHLEGDSFVVTTDDAHSWVEVLFPGYGWLPFEPTPGRSSPLGLPGTYLNPVAPLDEGGAPATEGEQGSGGGVGSLPGDLPPQIRNVEFLGGRRSGPVDLPFDVPTPSAAPAEPGYGLPVGLLVLGLLVLGAGALLAIPLAKTGRRAVALRRHRGPRERVLAAYRVFDGEAADLGLGRRPGETVLEHRYRLAQAGRSLDGHLDALVAVTVRAAYAPEALAPQDAELATRAARAAIRGLRRDVGAARVLLGIYRPGW